MTSRFTNKKTVEMKNTIMNGVNIISYAYIYIDVPRPLTNDLWVFLFTRLMQNT